MERARVKARNTGVVHVDLTDGFERPRREFDMRTLLTVTQARIGRRFGSLCVPKEQASEATNCLV